MKMEGDNENEESRNDQPVISYRGFKAIPFIIGMETLDRLSTFGTSSNLVVYLTTVFNLRNVTAAIAVNVFSGTSFLAPLLGGFLSDSYFGRYKTLAFSVFSSLLGMIVMMLTAVPKLHPQHCGTTQINSCVKPTSWQLIILITAFVFLVIGSGGFRPCLLAFGADQFNPTTESGKRDTSSFFSWYYFTLNLAFVISVTIIVYVQSNVSWAIGFAIPVVLMLIACTIFFSGSRMYVKVKPEGSPLTGLAQVIVAAISKRKLKLPNCQNLSCLFNYVPSNSLNSNLPHTDQFRFLDKSAIITADDQINFNGTPTNPWRLCSMQQVEEVKCIIRILPIWLSTIIHQVPIVQQDTYPVFQALQSDRHLGSGGFKVPAASYNVFSYLSPIIWIPIYDRILVPFLRKYTGKRDGITLLQRISIGMLISILTVLVSALVEEHRRNLALTRPIPGTVAPKGSLISSMSAFWLVPQFLLAGLSDAMSSIALLEFYYKQFPENMRSIGTSFYFCGVAGSSYLSSLLVSIVHHLTSKSGSSAEDWLPEDLNKGRLDFFYYMIAALCGVNFVYFLVCAKWYRYKGSGADNSSSATV